MKKVIFLLMVIAAFALSPVYSQTMTAAAFTGADSVITNAGTANVTYTVATNSNPSKVVVQVTLTKASGTGAGTCTLKGGLDAYSGYDTIMNAKFTPLDPALTTAINSTLTSVYTIRNVTSQNHTWEVVNPCYKIYQVFCTGSGTESVAMRAKIIATRP